MKINTWNDRDAERINSAVRTVESYVVNPHLGKTGFRDTPPYLVAARRIRGDTTGVINPGGTGTITGLKGVDGIVYETSPLTVRNKITGFAIPNGSTVLAQWVHEDEEWQIIEIAGQGSPTTPEPIAYGEMANEGVQDLTSPFPKKVGLSGTLTKNITADNANKRLVCQSGFNGYYLIHGSASARVEDTSSLTKTQCVQQAVLEIRQNGVAPGRRSAETGLFYFDLTGSESTVFNPFQLITVTHGTLLATNDYVELWFEFASSRTCRLIWSKLYAVRISGS